MDDLDARIKAANDEFISEEPEQEAITPVDIYQAGVESRFREDKLSRPRGARKLVMATINDVVNGAGTRSLARAYEKAKDDSAIIRKNGDRDRAELVARQYMERYFLPAVEIVVNFTSPDELLNCKEGLQELDKYALGHGAMSGYTASYVKTAYANAMGQVAQGSDPIIADGVARINGFLDSYQNALAKGLAQRLKARVDAGKNIASQEDYSLLTQVA